MKVLRMFMEAKPLGEAELLHQSCFIRGTSVLEVRLFWPQSDELFQDNIWK